MVGLPAAGFIVARLGGSGIFEVEEVLGYMRGVLASYETNSGVDEEMLKA